jgi:hypothetical protein
VILSIEIDRRTPGEKDEVVLTVRWPDERPGQICFFGCYRLDARLNFGVVAAETVRAAQELDDTDGLGRVREEWSRLGVDLSTLRCFTIETNSTGSVIEVYAQGWRRESSN